MGEFLIVESQFLETSKETEIVLETLGNSSGWGENSVCEHSSEGRETTFRLSFQEVQKNQGFKTSGFYCKCI